MRPDTFDGRLSSDPSIDQTGDFQVVGEASVAAQRVDGQIPLVADVAVNPELDFETFRITHWVWALTCSTRKLFRCQAKTGRALRGPMQLLLISRLSPLKQPLMQIPRWVYRFKTVAVIGTKISLATN